VATRATSAHPISWWFFILQKHKQFRVTLWFIPVNTFTTMQSPRCGDKGYKQHLFCAETLKMAIWNTEWDGWKVKATLPHALQTYEGKKGKRYSCNKPWRPTGLWDVEVLTFSRQSAHRWRWGCQPCAPASPYPQEDSWYSFLLQAESTPGHDKTAVQNIVRDNRCACNSRGTVENGVFYSIRARGS
jgi:hypothetical protein